MQRRSRGFTLVEAVVGMGVLGITLGIALPTYASFSAKARDASVHTALVVTLQRAATLAVASGKRVVICPSRDASRCGDGIDWSGGWIAFVDADGNRARAPDEPLVHVEAREDDGTRILGSPGRDRLVMQPRGSTGGSNTTFTICDRGNARHASQLILANAGRWRFADAPGAAAADCAYGAL